jgi:SEC-C motif-containing protein
MRSRFAAFALGLGAYLVDTLAADHEDRTLPRDALVRELGRVKDRQRFLDLTLVFASAEGDRGEVLFHARVFERGQDRSFAELSSFVREGDGAWRYARGVLLPAAELPCAASELTRAAFVEATRARPVVASTPCVPSASTSSAVPRPFASTTSTSPRAARGKSSST